MEKKYQQCTVCVMDNISDQYITFGDSGQCCYCKEAYAALAKRSNKKSVEDVIAEIKRNCTNDKYDCIMGISGGIDSSYVLYLGYKYNLRMLVVHIDDGFDTEISKKNIKNLVDNCKCDYHIITPDSQQFLELTKAYMKSGIKNIAAVQDNCLFTEIYRLARLYNIKYFITGYNSATESINAQDGYSVYDTVFMKDVAKKFNAGPIDKLHISSNIDLIKRQRFSKVKTVPILEYMEYSVEEAFNELQNFCGFEYYGRKHLENTLTAFTQLRWYPEKHRVDKRKWHLSSMIVSGQKTREEAIKELHDPIGTEDELKKITEITATKLGMDIQTLEELLAASPRSHEEYRNSKAWIRYNRLMRLLSTTKKSLMFWK